MSVFVDTSAYFAVLDADDEEHQRARDEWQRLLAAERELFTSNYVIVETIALLQSRIGIEAVRLFRDDIMPVIKIFWVDSSVHEMAMQILLTASRRQLSLVDCVSFQIMRARGIRSAFCFDPHFAKQGFRSLPG